MAELLEDREDFARHVSLKTPNYLSLGPSFARAAPHVGSRSLLVSQSNNDHAIQRRVGLMVTTSVETVPVCLARGGRDRTHTAEGGKGGFRFQALGIIAGGDEEGIGAV